MGLTLLEWIWNIERMNPPLLLKTNKQRCAHIVVTKGEGGKKKLVIKGKGQSDGLYQNGGM